MICVELLLVRDVVTHYNHVYHLYVPTDIARVAAVAVDAVTQELVHLVFTRRSITTRTAVTLVV